MQTLSREVGKLVARSPTAVREALRKLRDPNCQSVTVPDGKGGSVEIRPVHPTSRSVMLDRRPS